MSTGTAIFSSAVVAVLAYLAVAAGDKGPSSGGGYTAVLMATGMALVVDNRTGDARLCTLSECRPLPSFNQ